jgi:hypothetical protein
MLVYANSSVGINLNNKSAFLDNAVVRKLESLSDNLSDSFKK